MAQAFFGGVHPHDMKAATNEKAIEQLAPPAVVVIPMSMHFGAPCTPLVKAGDHVKVGQKIGEIAGLGAPIHASVSGKVVAVEARPHPNGTTVLSVVIANDFQETVSPEVRPRADLSGLSAGNLMDIIREAGIVGMGGATFPTHVKITSGIGKVNTVIINGAECEPYITADERLLREQPDRVLRGLEVLMEILDQKQAVIGMEDNKPAAAAAVEAALLRHPGIRLQLLKDRYPQGAEKQLIQALTGCQVPPGGLPASVGCAVFNAATCAAVGDAVWDGMPLVKRVVTVSGELPKSFVVTDFPVQTVFISPISARTLQRRCERIENMDQYQRGGAL